VVPEAVLRRPDLPDPEPIDLVGAAGGSVAKRAVPALGVLVLLLLLIRVLRKR
jgi:hypothetical protein